MIMRMASLAELVSFAAMCGQSAGFAERGKFTN